jgi:internalin A
MARDQKRIAVLRNRFRPRLGFADPKEQMNPKEQMKVTRHWNAALAALLVCGLSVATALAADIRSGGDAKWVADAGGAVIRDSAGRVTGVDLRASWVTDTDLRKLLQFPSLSYLDLSLTRITDQGMVELRNAPGIVELNLYYAEYVTDEGLAAIKDWKKLKRLNVHGAKISDTTLDHISGIATLESVNIGSANITDVGIERLVSLPNLKELTMGGNAMGDAGLQALRQIPGLTYLDLNGRQGTDANVWAISISEKGLDAVLTLKELRELRFGCTSLPVGIEGSRFAMVSATDVSDGWLEKMKALPKLEKLKLQGCARVNDEAIRTLIAMPNLREVDLKGTSVTDKGLAALRAAKPKLQIYSGPWDAKAANFRNN